AAHPTFLPGEHAVMRAKPREQRADRVAVTHDHPDGAAHVPGLGLDLKPPGRADQRQGGLGPRTGDFQRRRAPRLGQRPPGQERASPRRLGIVVGAIDDQWRQPANGAAAAVDQSGLPGQLLPVAYDTYDVPAFLTQPSGGDDGEVAVVAEHLRNVTSQPAGRYPRIKLGLDDDLAADDMKAAAEPEQRRDLGLTAARLGELEASQLVLHGCGHRHTVILPHPDAARADVAIVATMPRGR